MLIRHASAQTYPAMNTPKGYDELRAALTALSWEGLVWHHPDGRMAKLKRRDFPAGVLSGEPTASRKQGALNGPAGSPRRAQNARH